jgi:O-antigen/teichoic acid export membrane protein
MDGGAEKDVSIGELARAGAANGRQEKRTRWWGKTGTGRRLELWSRLFDSDSVSHALALLDQAVVSGTSFVTTVLIGRWCGASELGVYALGFSVLVSWGVVHQSLIALPYTIYRHRSGWGTPEEYAGSALVHNGLMSAIAVVALAVGAALLSLGGPMPGLPAVLWALAGVMPFALLREFSRRFAFAHLRMTQALVLDLAVAAVQLPGLFWLASTGTLAATTAYVAFGAGCALSGAVWLYLDRSNFSIRGQNVWPTLQQSWSLGRWLFASQVTVWLQAYFIHWLLACVVGPTATGVYAACMTVVMFSNPLLLGISNALAPRAAQAFVEGGGPRLSRVVFETTLLLGTAMALFCAVILFAGEDIMGLLYHGQQYEGHGNTVAVLAIAMLASALGMPASNGLAAAERPDLTFKAGLLAVVLSLILVPCLVMAWGVGGAAYGFLAGTVVGSLGRWAGFLFLLRRQGRQRDPAASMTQTLPAGSCLNDTSGGTAASLLHVLHEFCPSSEANGWVTKRLNEGVQASIFAVGRPNGQPVWQTHNELAVKLYKPAVHPPVDVVHRQFAALSQLHTRLSGSAVHGWNIRSPLPLYQCGRPLALVMTMVPGRSLNSCLGVGKPFASVGDPLTSQTLESIAQAVVAAMERCWSFGSQAHGDFNFDNILCDVPTRTLSFVDPGVVDEALLCNEVSRDWYPASRDLAYLLFETSVSLRRTLGNPRARRRQQWMLDRVLRAFLQRIASADKRISLLDEIEACARVHLRMLHASWSPQGIWRLFLKRSASRYFDRILGKLRTEIQLSCEGP